MRVKRIIGYIAIVGVLAVLLSSSAPREVSRAATAVSELQQVDAGFGAVNGEDFKSHYVTIMWRGTAANYALYQLLPNDRETKLGVVTPVEQEPQLFMVTINRLKAGLTMAFRVYESDAAGEKLSAEDPGAMIEGVKTLPGQQAAPKLAYWYRNSSKADFSIKTDGFSDGYQVRAETPKGKILVDKNVTAPAASGEAASFTLKPAYHGRVVRVKVRGYVKIGGQKKYGDWSTPYVFASAKKVKMSGYKDAIKLSGISVTGAKKKEIYISRKEKKGFKLAKTLGSKTTSCKIGKYGDKYIESDKTYYVRIYYYYKLDGEEHKCAVYDRGKVYVKPTYFYLPVE